MDRLTEHVEDRDMAYNRATKVGAQLGNWAIAVNAGGVAFILVAVRDGSAEQPLPLATPYMVLLAGLFCGFLGHILIGVTFLSSWRAHNDALVAYRKRLDEDEPDSADAAAVRIRRMTAEAELGRKLPNTVGFFGLLGFLLYACSLALAAWGLITPLTLGILGD